MNDTETFNPKWGGAIRLDVDDARIIVNVWNRGERTPSEVRLRPSEARLVAEALIALSAITEAPR